MTEERKSHAKDLVRAATGREVAEVLRDLYIDKRLSQEEIASALEAKIASALGVKDASVHRMTISNWLREYGITRDDRPAVAL